MGQTNGSQSEVHASDARLKPQCGVLFLGIDCKAQDVMPGTSPWYALSQRTTFGHARCTKAGEAVGQVRLIRSHVP